MHAIKYQSFNSSMSHNPRPHCKTAIPNIKYMDVLCKTYRLIDIIKLYMWYIYPHKKNMYIK